MKRKSGGHIGQWDNRLELRVPRRRPVEGEYCGLVPGYVKRDTVAWFCSHRHHPKDGNEFYRYSYLFKYGFDVPARDGDHAADNEKARFAITVPTTDATVAASANTLKNTAPNRSPRRSAGRRIATSHPSR